MAKKKTANSNVPSTEDLPPVIMASTEDQLKEALAELESLKAQLPTAKPVTPPGDKTFKLTLTKYPKTSKIAKESIIGGCIDESEAIRRLLANNGVVNTSSYTVRADLVS